MIRNLLALSFCPFILIALVLGQTQNAEVTVSVAPQVPLIERRDHRQLLNFDFTVSNRGKSTWRLTEIEVSVWDAADRLVVRKTVNSDGLASGIEIVAPTLLMPGEVLDIFNPFYSFSEDVPIHRTHYAFRYLRENNEQEAAKNRHRLPMEHDLEVEATVIARDYSARTNLILPLAGRVFVWEGHDFYAHHRRVPLHAADVQKLGIHANANRYGSDLVIVDEQGRMYHDDSYDTRRGSLRLMSNRSVNGRGIGGDAHPALTLVQPGVDKALPARVGFASFYSLDAQNSACDSDVSVDVHFQGFRRDLLLLRVGRLHAGEEFFLGLDAAVVIDQDNGIVEDGVECPGVGALVGLVPELFEGNDFALDTRVAFLGHGQGGGP